MRALIRRHIGKETPGKRPRTGVVTRTGLIVIASAALAGASVPALFTGVASALTNPVCSPSAGTVTCVFSYTGSTNTNGTAIAWPVPAGITSVTVTADGATGGPSGATANPGAGGAGGEVSATLSNIPAATTLSVFPGGEGVAGGSGGVNQQASTIPLTPAGRGGNAGAGRGSGVDGGSGGGASTVSVVGAGQPFSNVLVAAGGGGGGAGTLAGGNAGTGHHPDGDSGDGANSATGGGGGTLATGGAGGGGAGLGCALSFGLPGSALHGGDGASGVLVVCPSGGGGGGSGYFGGGGGGGNYASGGGGSSYPNVTQIVKGITVTPNTSDDNQWTAGNGQVTITYSLLTTGTSVNCQPNPSSPGQSVTCTATITPNSVAGTVNFEANGTTIGGCGSQTVTSGTAMCTTTTLPNGDSTITAIFTPTNNLVYAGSQGSTDHQVVSTPTHLRNWLVVHADGTYTLFAQLTASRSGLSGETITFNAGRTGPVLCQATTGGGGVASCRLSRSETRELLRYNGAFTATFAGAGQYEPSSAYYRGIPWF